MAVSDQSNPSADRNFVKTAMQAPLLEPDHERSLALRWRDEGDETALHELNSAYVRLVISIVKDDITRIQISMPPNPLP